MLFNDILFTNLHEPRRMSVLNLFMIICYYVIPQVWILSNKELILWLTAVRWTISLLKNENYSKFTYFGKYLKSDQLQILFQLLFAFLLCLFVFNCVFKKIILKTLPHSWDDLIVKDILGILLSYYRLFQNRALLLTDTPNSTMESDIRAV